MIKPSFLQYSKGESTFAEQCFLQILFCLGFVVRGSEPSLNFQCDEAQLQHLAPCWHSAEHEKVVARDRIPYVKTNG